ncbi:MAG TPA: hypothetical protein VG963_29175, partial [Polyangiaceae bacterium]|nr:hypothetical protein [Polyangiaceae bacterium]
MAQKKRGKKHPNGRKHSRRASDLRWEVPAPLVRSASRQSGETTDSRCAPTSAAGAAPKSSTQDAGEDRADVFAELRRLASATLRDGDDRVAEIEALRAAGDHSG